MVPAAWFVCCLAIVFCVGTNCAELGDYECDKNFEKVGCFKDNWKRDFTDFTSFRGKIEWGNMAEWIERLACACASIARKNGSPYFGLQYIGECWTGTKAGVQYGNPKKASQRCQNSQEQECGPEDPICVGKEWTNYIYKLSEGCTDVDSEKCASLASEGLCNHHYPAVLEQCPKSCKLC